MWFVYILKCSDGLKYVGCTSDINARMKRHQGGGVWSTSKRLPVELVTYIAFTNRYKAFELERYLKSGSGRAFMNKRLI